MRRSGRIFSWSRLLVGQPRLRLPGLGAVSRYFPTGCCCILIFLHRARLPLYRKYRFLGLKVPKRLSIVGSHSTRANPLPPIWNNYTRQCFGCRYRCRSRERVKNMLFQSLPTLIRNISSRWSKTACIYTTATLSNWRSWYVH